MEKFTNSKAQKPQKPTKLSPFVIRATMQMATTLLQMRDDCNPKSPDYYYLDDLYTDFQAIVRHNQDNYLEEED